MTCYLSMTRSGQSFWLGMKTVNETLYLNDNIKAKNVYWARQKRSGWDMTLAQLVQSPIFLVTKAYAIDFSLLASNIPQDEEALIDQFCFGLDNDVKD